jgi:hypothetical protein
MGTRGFISFVVDGTEKTAYNHWDSYPDALGSDVLKWLRHVCEVETGPEVLLSEARNLRVVSPQDKPTAEDVARFSQFSWNKDQHGGDSDLREGQEWYDLLHETQGNPMLILQAGVIEDAGKFPLDSLFAEWGYVIDLDAQQFEAYQGFQHSPHSAGRFADRPSATDGYYPVALAASWPLGSLPTDAEFLAALESGDDE